MNIFFVPPFSYHFRRFFTIPLMPAQVLLHKKNNDHATGTL
jgi:hypothetical protein